MSITGRVALDGRGLGGRSRLLPLDTICGSACISLWSLELDDEDDDDVETLVIPLLLADAGPVVRLLEQ